MLENKSKKNRVIMAILSPTKCTFLGNPQPYISKYYYYNVVCITVLPYLNNIVLLRHHDHHAAARLRLGLFLFCNGYFVHPFFK